MNQSCNMNKSVCLFDLLNSEKFLAGVYNESLLESATPEVSGCLMGILEDEHRIQSELFNTMNQKGFYPVKKAEETKLNAAKQQFAKN